MTDFESDAGASKTSGITTCKDWLNDQPLNQANISHSTN